MSRFISVIFGFVFIVVSFSVLTATEVTKEKRTPFLKNKKVTVPSISASVGEGKAIYTKGKNVNIVEVKLNGSVEVKNNKACYFCLKTSKIAPNLKVPISLFKDSDMMFKTSYNFEEEFQNLENVLLSVDIGKYVGNEFIVSGPKGATLLKDGKGFILVDGEAYLLQLQRKGP